MNIAEQILGLVKSIKSFDKLEQSHIDDAISWMSQTDALFRIQKPATPPKHLVSYFVLVDTNNHKLLLLNHIKSGLLLPSGGHVEDGEHPKLTVEREVVEELNIHADFLNEKPFFLTVNETLGESKHTDVSFWYVLKGDSSFMLSPDPGEYTGYKWFTPEEVKSESPTKFDRNMFRFIDKLTNAKYI